MPLPGCLAGPRSGAPSSWIHGPLFGMGRRSRVLSDGTPRTLARDSGGRLSHVLGPERERTALSLARLSRLSRQLALSLFLRLPRMRNPAVQRMRIDLPHSLPLHSVAEIGRPYPMRDVVAATF